MATVTAEKFIELVSRSELADADRLRAALEKIRADHAGELPTDVVALARRCSEKGSSLAGTPKNCCRASTRASSWASTSCWDTLAAAV